MVDAAVHDDASALHADSASVFGRNIVWLYFFEELNFTSRARAQQVNIIHS